MDHSLDAHARPPDDLRQFFKQYQKAPLEILAADEDIFDDAAGKYGGFVHSHQASIDLGQRPLETVFSIIRDQWPVEPNDFSHDAEVYEHPALPGLYIYPSLLTPAVQLALIDRLFHEHVPNPAHNNNIALHYTTATTNKESWFHPSHSTTTFDPKDPTMHSPLPMSKALSKSLRWITLGGQYDWTAKRYPDTHSETDTSPPFPTDIAALISALFPAVTAQAAILNVYRPGDVLAPHRDVSEQCSRPLVSISLGCDGLFVVGVGAQSDGEDGDKGTKMAVLRLRSGDVLVMSSAARWAWHGVPRVLGGTCPEYLSSWPCSQGRDGMDEKEVYGAWSDWLDGRRINLNVRQMFD